MKQTERFGPCSRSSPRPPGQGAQRAEGDRQGDEEDHHRRAGAAEQREVVEVVVDVVAEVVLDAPGDGDRDGARQAEEEQRQPAARPLALDPHVMRKAGVGEDGDRDDENADQTGDHVAVGHEGRGAADPGEPGEDDVDDDRHRHVEGHRHQQQAQPPFQRARGEDGEEDQQRREQRPDRDRRLLRELQARVLGDVADEASVLVGPARELRLQEDRRQAEAEEQQGGDEPAPLLREPWRRRVRGERGRKEMPRVRRAGSRTPLCRHVRIPKAASAAQQRGALIAADLGSD